MKKEVGLIYKIHDELFYINKKSTPNWWVVNIYSEHWGYTHNTEYYAYKSFIEIISSKLMTDIFS